MKALVYNGPRDVTVTDPPGQPRGPSIWMAAGNAAGVARRTCPDSARPIPNRHSLSALAP
jgi:hypothetical protein